MSEHLFTSESVTEGHPDKIADQVSDSVLDAIIRDDPTGRVACETLVTTGQVIVAGEITTNAYVDIPGVVRDRIRQIGYVDSRDGFDAGSCGVSVAIDPQSPDIAQGVNTAHEVRGGGAEDPFDAQGAGDQGLMFGYASDETPQLMPLPITLAHRMAERLSEVRRDGTLAYLRPDGKSQVSVRYVDGMPVGIDTVVVSSQHTDDIGRDQISEDVAIHVIQPVLEQYGFWSGNTAHVINPLNPTDDMKFFVNPTGKFVIGGPMGDVGLTGRKIIVDTYGGMARHGGGAFSGKDPSKVDRSAAYAARWVAKNVVAAGFARRCELQVAYAIGMSHPVSVMVETFGTETRSEEDIKRWVNENFDLRPAAILERLDLRRPIYAKTAAYGHFGRELPEFTWENTDIGLAEAG